MGGKKTTTNTYPWRHEPWQTHYIIYRIFIKAQQLLIFMRVCLCVRLSVSQSVSLPACLLVCLTAVFWRHYFESIWLNWDVITALCLHTYFTVYFRLICYRKMFGRYVCVQVCLHAEWDTVYTKELGMRRRWRLPWWGRWKRLR
jgi:hypothetical protein